MAEENDIVRKTTEEQIKKVRQEFKGYQKKKLEERNRVVAGAQKAANMYKELIESVGEESEAPMTL